MKKILIAILIAWGCHHEPTVYYGLPNAGTAQCGSFYDTGEAICINDSKTYACVADDGCNPGKVSCALASGEVAQGIRARASEARQRERDNQTQSLVISNMAMTSSSR